MLSNKLCFATHTRELLLLLSSVVGKLENYSFLEITISKISFHEVKQITAERSKATGFPLLLCNSLSDLNQFVTNATSHTKVY